MRTVSIFRNGQNRAIRIPKDMDFEGVTELDIMREGEALILRPHKGSWDDFFSTPGAEDFSCPREDVIEEGRVKL